MFPADPQMRHRAGLRRWRTSGPPRSRRVHPRSTARRPARSRRRVPRAAVRRRPSPGFPRPPWPAPRRRRRPASSACAAILASRSLCSRNSRNANAVVAKPPGTRIPAWPSWLIISPSDAFLPPTWSTSPIRRPSKGITRWGWLIIVRIATAAAEGCCAAPIDLGRGGVYRDSPSPGDGCCDAGWGPEQRTRRSGFQEHRMPDRRRCARFTSARHPDAHRRAA